MLRDYQQRTLTELYKWLETKQGNPCVVMPTGSGKSHIVAALCKDALQQWPETRILMLTHVKELIEQNAEKMRQHWPDAPLGIYSASIGIKQMDCITFAGIQSIRNKADEIGHIDLCIIDECFVAGTKVQTSSGPIDIDKVKCGDVVFNQCGLGIVEARSIKPVFDTYLLEFEDGRSIECTGNHPFFTSNGWIKARELENGTYIFGIQDMSVLWESISTLDQTSGKHENHFSHAGASMEKANLLLRVVCEEITSNSIECSSQEENKHNSQRNSAQTHSSWRQRAIAAFASIGASSCAGRRMESGIFGDDECRTQKRNLSECLQDRHSKSGKDDCNRIRRRVSFNLGKAIAKSKEKSIFNGSRVVSVSHIKRESPVPVYNIQVSGHPSYFVGGLAVHNCHLVSHNEQGGYRKLLAALLAINPHLRVIGLTATPYRLGHGLITDKPALFDALLEPVGIEELVHKGYLAPLRSKLTIAKLDVSGVHKRGGEYIEAELQKAVNTDKNNSAVVAEVIRLASDRKAWLFFCAGVDHAQMIAFLLNIHGIPAACITGETPKPERERIISEYKAGKLRALTNANVLTTGFDYPDIDLIAMLRPTMSASLYVQMAGRGMRPKSHTDHCLVLDFAGVVATHGPITAVVPPSKGGAGNGEAPVKVCDACGELVHLSARQCSACGTPFPEPKAKKLKLHDDDIMGIEGKTLNVTSWAWRVQTSQKNGKKMLVVSYYGGLSDPVIREYLTVLHDGIAGGKARNIVSKYLLDCNVTPTENMEETARLLTLARPPAQIEYKMDGQYHRVLRRTYATQAA